MFVSATSPLVLYMYNFVSLFIAGVGLNECKIIAAHPTLTIMSKSVLRTFEAEILQIFKNIQPQPKN